jgi:hypothetical protein
MTGKEENIMIMTKELLLPVGCQLMDEEEMTYVEGGKTVYHNSSGTITKFTGAETERMLNDTAYVGAALAAAFGFTSAGPTIALLVALISGMLYLMNRDGSGVSIKKPPQMPTGVLMITGPTLVLDNSWKTTQALWHN